MNPTAVIGIVIAPPSFLAKYVLCGAVKLNCEQSQQKYTCVTVLVSIFSDESEIIISFTGLVKEPIYLQPLPSAELCVIAPVTGIVLPPQTIGVTALLLSTLDPVGTIVAAVVLSTYVCCSTMT